MYQTVIEIVFIVVAFVVGNVYGDHIKDIGHRLREGNYWAAVVGMWNSGTFIGISLLVAMVILVILLHRAQERAANRKNAMRDAKLVDDIGNKVSEANKLLVDRISEANRPLIDTINALIDEIRNDRNERNNQPNP